MAAQVAYVLGLLQKAADLLATAESIRFMSSTGGAVDGPATEQPKASLGNVGGGLLDPDEALGPPVPCQLPRQLLFRPDVAGVRAQIPAQFVCPPVDGRDQLTAHANTPTGTAITGAAEPAATA
jgi:hypothetical protein